MYIIYLLNIDGKKKKAKTWNWLVFKIYKIDCGI